MKTAIFGASGFSRETADICIALRVTDLVFIESNPTQGRCFGFPVEAEAVVPRLAQEGYSFVIGIGDNKIRKKIFTLFPDLHYPNLIHPSASFGHKQEARISQGAGNIITAGARFTNEIESGNFGIYNLNCTIGHDCKLADFINIAPGANVSGNVEIQEGAYIGTNACIIQGKSIQEKRIVGRYSTVGAGSVVTKNVPDGVVVRGIPAK